MSPPCTNQGPLPALTVYLSLAVNFRLFCFVAKNLSEINYRYFDLSLFFVKLLILIVELLVVWFECTLQNKVVFFNFYMRIISFVYTDNTIAQDFNQILVILLLKPYYILVCDSDSYFCILTFSIAYSTIFVDVVHSIKCIL